MSTSMRAQVSWLVIATAAISGCLPKATTHVVDSNLGPGWNCLATPSAFDGPGVIFRVTQDGTKFTVVDSTTEAAVERAPFAATKAGKTTTISADIVARMIGMPLSVDGKAASKYVVEQSFSGAEELNTVDDKVSTIISKFYSRTDLDPSQRYYLVRRAIVARSVKYDFDRDISDSFGTDLALKVVSIKPSASYNSSNGFHYQDTFAVPQNVCIVAQWLPVPRPAGTGAAPPVPPPDNTPLFIRSK
ncbi:hypothetical protein [Cupriavidus sp. DF5525]|uniref:hypothetical protein n=1 Tax=Cupriavidus sp. DF5525 TaxID=3160989 RepID=UPI0032DF7613